MTLGVFARASQGVLRKLGEDALLDGEAAGRVNIEYNVVLTPGMLGTADDNHVAQADVATIGSEYEPRVGRTLTHPDGTFKLDRRIEDNGYAKRFIVVRMVPP